MDLVMNNSFSNLDMNEMMLIEGGDIWRNIGYAGATACCVCACIATGGWAVTAAGAAAAWYWYDAT